MIILIIVLTPFVRDQKLEGAAPEEAMRDPTEHQIEHVERIEVEQM